MPDQPQFGVGIDAGSATTRCIVSAIDDGTLRYLGHGEIDSAGWTKGRLTDPAAASEASLSFGIISFQ